MGGCGLKKVTKWLQFRSKKNTRWGSRVHPQGVPLVVTLWALRPSYQPGGSRRFPHVAITFIYRTVGLRRAVEDFISQVLQTLVGLTLTSSDSWALLGFPHLCLDYTTLLAACQELFLRSGSFLSRRPQRSGSWGKVLQTLVGQPVPLGLPSPRLLCLYYNRFAWECQVLF